MRRPPRPSSPWEGYARSYHLPLKLPSAAASIFSASARQRRASSSFPQRESSFAIAREQAHRKKASQTLSPPQSESASFQSPAPIRGRPCGPKPRPTQHFSARRACPSTLSSSSDAFAVS